MADDMDNLSSNSSLSSDSVLSRDRSPRHSFDEYSDMRLDVDSMSYEELLALGESIGHVCTGVPEDLISTCLTKKKHSSSEQNRGIRCSVCLDAYRTKDEIGAINKCGHEYHAACITKWLMMNNTCPICKCAAL